MHSEDSAGGRTLQLRYQCGSSCRLIAAVKIMHAQDLVIQYSVVAVVIANCIEGLLQNT
jgi:hypothetical protein